MELLYTFHTANPSRRVVVKANSEESAKKNLIACEMLPDSHKILQL